MKREEAEELIGSLVVTGMVNSGYYIGELLEIIPSKPFRANVKIKGVFKYPNLYYHNTIPLQFKSKYTVLNENEIVNTGNDIKKYEGEFTSYHDSLEVAILEYLESVQRTLDEFIKKKNQYFTRYIGNSVDTIELRKRLIHNLAQRDNGIADLCKQEKLESCNGCKGNTYHIHEDGKCTLLPGVFVCANDTCELCKCLNCNEK